MDKLTIATRATRATGKDLVFYKSYVKNIKLAEIREIKGHKLGYCEQDYFFEYKDKLYRINEHIVPTKNGTKIYSARFIYTLEEVVNE